MWHCGCINVVNWLIDTAMSVTVCLYDLVKLFGQVSLVNTEVNV